MTNRELCKRGKHDWVYHGVNNHSRTCSKCGREEIDR